MGGDQADQDGDDYYAHLGEGEKPRIGNRWNVSAKQIVLLEWEDISAETAEEAIELAKTDIEPDEDKEVIDNRDYKAVPFEETVIFEIATHYKIPIPRLTMLVKATRTRDGWPKEDLKMSHAEYWAIQDVDTRLEG